MNKNNSIPKPFYVITTGPVKEGIEYIYSLPYFYGMPYADGESKSVVACYNTTDIPTLARRLKDDFDHRPEGARFVQLDLSFRALYALAEDYMYFDKATESVRNWMVPFLQEYSRIGGKLDGIITDVEYINGSAYEIWDFQFEKGNKGCYWQIVNHPQYETVLRPKLERLGFQFWPKEQQDVEKAEIWSMSPVHGMNTKEYAIWNIVLGELIGEYIHKSVFEPLLKYYPNALLNDYGRMDGYGWQKSHSGTMRNVLGNHKKVGNVSNRQCYPYEPWENWINRYITPDSFNNAKYEATPFNLMLWSVNQAKNMYEADTDHRISSWITFFNFQPKHPGSSSNTPYYSETIYHIGLLNPQPFLGYIVEGEVVSYGSEFSDPKISDYNYALEIVSELMGELNRLVGSDDRKPIFVPSNWNCHFMLSGMHSGGKNIWRITPDTAVGTTLQTFKVKDNDPTFYIHGQTISFPQGKIITDSKISQVGTCGYWVETPADVMPVLTGSADRYEKNPSFAEDFACMANDEPNTDAWVVSGSAFNLKNNGENMGLGITGTTTVRNINAPKNITAGDSYAKRQVWQVTITAPVAGELILLRCSNKDLGIKITNGKAYFDNGGTYKELSGVTISAGNTYVIKREVNFCNTNSFTSAFTLCDASGNILGVGKESILNAAMPIEEITMETVDVSGMTYIKDYRLYPAGLTADFMVYDAMTGFEVDACQPRDNDAAYRLSWLNATGEDMLAKIYNGNVLVGECLMGAGLDGVDTGVVRADNSASLLWVKIDKCSLK